MCDKSCSASVINVYLLHRHAIQQKISQVLVYKRGKLVKTLPTIVHWVDTVDHELQEAMAEVAVAVAVPMAVDVAVASRARCRA